MPDTTPYDYSTEGLSTEGPSSISSELLAGIERVKRDLENEPSKKLRLDIALGPQSGEVGAAWKAKNWTIGAYSKAPWNNPKALDWGVRVTASW